MPQLLSLDFTPEAWGSKETLYAQAAATLRIPKKDISHIQIQKLSLDARGRVPLYRATVQVFVQPERYADEPLRGFPLPSLAKGAPRVLIVGMGPAGLFAALTLAAAGIRPVIFERGKPVRERKRDVAHIGRGGLPDPDSNYSFGEGGAGCFSDGKLYTRSNKRGDIHRVLRTFVHFGAKEEILYQAHPHLGSDRMPAMVEKMRESLLQAGAEIHFNTRITGIHADKKGRFAAVTDQNGTEYKADYLILACGNSACDLYRYLHGQNILLQEKPFAMGVRLEHPQETIDAMQYKGAERRYNLPPAEYAFAEQCAGTGVFSFCMCPGGVVVPASTVPDTLVVNGMSDSGRRSPWANAGWVAGVNRALLQQNGYKLSDSPLALLEFQQQTERHFFTPGKGLAAPAQRLPDFLNRKTSSTLPRSSYPPGVFTADMGQYLPGFIAEALREAWERIARKKRGFLTQEAILLGLESRTSSPVRIVRDAETLEHPDMPGLYPCGEGAGYAGGITSSAIDGINCAERIIAKIS
ncbi:MAG: FAD-dependent monooxygenase [Bacteroides sp.]|nr:FAD-dependent monooxygenase [Ruminococcus flavefaciens]MCM1554905.1 FAD-dependent monooxygenase [Bacteroides sp.]